ncbi:MAG: N-formylglutamate amidohydrolase [Acidobacteria bacterium]|nr:N-formylglutamate amidohydrolase [Acidobacteriota bacterium]
MQIITYAESRLVKRHRGAMPVILTAPHGGDQSPPGVDERTDAKTPAGCDFTTSRDRETALITESVAQKILDLTGLSPYVVIARFHRRFIDANRSENCAFTDPDAKPFYDEYHARIAGYVDEIRTQNANRGFLFDIHGNQVIESDPADIYLGTDNGGSLLPGFDRASIFMQHGLAGLLKSVRRESAAPPLPLFQYRVSPANATVRETSSVDGGFTVRHYGAFINSIQIEIADTIRLNDQKRPFLFEDLAFAIINFVRRHAAF